MNAAIDPTRLYTVLDQANLKSKQPALWQLLYNLIGNVVNLKNSSSSGSGGGSGSNVVINETNIQQLLGLLGDGIDGESIVIPGPQGLSGNVGPMGPPGNDGINGETIIIPGTGGSGDVSGPASAVDSEVVVFNGTSGKAIKATGSAAAILSSGQLQFPATQNPSSNANTLDDYEEGSFTPIDASGAGLSFSAAGGIYVKIGKIVLFNCQFVYPATANGLGANVGGLPFTVAAANSGAYQSFGFQLMWLVNASSTVITPLSPTTNVQRTNAQMSGLNNVIVGQYLV